MPCDYYVWKWADNDAPGQPAQVVRQLETGDLPPAIQPFRVWQVQPRLAEVLRQFRGDLSEIHVDPYATEPGATRFIRLRHPIGNDPVFTAKLLRAVWEAELTLYNATLHRLIGLPKRNVVEYPGGRQYVDIEVADIPGLLHELAAEPGLVALACYDHAGNMFQVWSHRARFAVEWQVLPGRDFRRHRIWVAGRPAQAHRRRRLGTLESGLDLFAPELLELAEVYELWKSFLVAPIRPPSHRWRDVTQTLDHPGQPRRYRHQEQTEDHPHERQFGKN